jgi:hypothetical protein
LAGILRHVTVWGIEQTSIFRDDVDRTDCVVPLATLADQGAWALLWFRP